MKKYYVLDLFSGAGGMAEGFLQAGFHIPYASDKSQQAADTYIHRHTQLGFPVKYYCGDITKLAEPKELKSFLNKDLNNIDVVCGGPPCQGFSLAGQRKTDDIRNLLVKSYIKILSQVKPKYFVMENVLGILSAQFSKYTSVITKKKYKNTNVINVLKNEFKAIGYSRVNIKTLDASEFGVPQKRNRVIFLGTRDDIEIELTHPIPTQLHPVSTKEAIDDLATINNGSIVEKYTRKATSEYQKNSRKGRTLNINGKTISNEKLTNHQTSVHTSHVIERFSLLKQGETVRAMLHRLNDEEKERFKTKKLNCKRLVAKHPSATVLTLPDDLVHYSKNRILTVREMARLQSFDDSFEFVGKRTTGGNLRKSETPQYTLVGNAVPPLLAYAIAKKIMDTLNELER